MLLCSAYYGGDVIRSELCSGPQSLYLTLYGNDVDTILRDADRVFGILRENNPELTGEKRRTIMKPPQVRAWRFFSGACIQVTDEMPLVFVICGDMAS